MNEVRTAVTETDFVQKRLLRNQDSEVLVSPTVLRLNRRAVSVPRQATFEDRGGNEWRNGCAGAMRDDVLAEVCFSIRFLMTQCLVCGMFSAYNRSFSPSSRCGDTPLPLRLDL